MRPIADAERARYEDVWSSLPTYGDYSPGERWVDAFLSMSGTIMRGSILDAGCGSGKGGVALRAKGFYPVALCDITDDGLIPEARAFLFTRTCLWGNLKRDVRRFYDWVYCTDVLEHIPTEWTMLAVARMLEVSRRGCFFSIAFVPDNYGAFLGTSLHQTVESFVWWKTRLQEVGHVVEARDLLTSGLFLVKPR